MSKNKKNKFELGLSFVMLIEFFARFIISSILLFYIFNLNLFDGFFLFCLNAFLIVWTFVSLVGSKNER